MVSTRLTIAAAPFALVLVLSLPACGSAKNAGTGSGGSSGGNPSGVDGSQGGSAGGSQGGNAGASDGGDVGKSYPMTFTCEADAGASCPEGQPCPEVPSSATSCGDLPAVLGHPAIPETTSRPLGCTAGLPFGNSFYNDMQQTCTCMPTIGSPGTASWYCPL
jgi:hypothetical protein